MRGKGGNPSTCVVADEALSRTPEEALPHFPAARLPDQARLSTDQLCNYRFKMIQRVYGTSAAYIVMGCALKWMARPPGTVLNPMHFESFWTNAIALVDKDQHSQHSTSMQERQHRTRLRRDRNTEEACSVPRRRRRKSPFEEEEDTSEH